jgi:hypothetical protein
LTADGAPVSCPFRHDTPRLGEFQPEFAPFHGDRRILHELEPLDRPKPDNRIVEWLALGCRIEELELVETPVDVGQGPSGPSEPSERFCDSHFNTDGRADDRSNTQDRPSDRPSVSNPLKQKVKDGPDDVDERILTLTGDAHGTDLAEAEI